MRTLRILSILWMTTAASPAWSQIDKFPYEAVVQGDSVHVRSGPGLRYYATGKVHQGDRVRVIRHDPGGWYVIEPPPGSFSWIKATDVEKTDATTGVVRLPPLADGQVGQAIVRIGSELTDDASVYSRRLDAGDIVEITGEETLTLDRGQVLMYRIRPPAQEFRWVKGDFIVPAGAIERQQHDLDPFTVPSAQKRPTVTVEEFGDIGPANAPQLAPPLAGSDAEEGPAAPLSNDLEALDRQLTEMLAQDPATWRLDEFEQQYHALLPNSDPVNAALIRKRISAIAARKRAHADYLDFVRLTTETTLREQQLRAVQTGQFPAQPAAYPQVQLGAPQPVPDGSPTPASLPGPGGQPRPTRAPRIEPIPDQPASDAPTGPVTPKFDGAGIIRRSGNPIGTVPPYVLISPQGRLLAFLEPGPRMNLEPYVGRSMGVIGQRGFDARLQADRIVVRRLQPVQLQP